jgi:hypothetical protein
MPRDQNLGPALHRDSRQASARSRTTSTPVKPQAASFGAISIHREDGMIWTAFPAWRDAGSNGLVAELLAARGLDRAWV